MSGGRAGRLGERPGSKRCLKQRTPCLPTYLPVFKSSLYFVLSSLSLDIISLCVFRRAATRLTNS